MDYVEVVSILHENGLIGERGLMAPGFSPHTFRTLTFCEMFSAPCRAARALISDYPLVKHRVRKLVVRSIWQKVLRSGYFSSLLADGRGIIFQDVQREPGSSKLV